MISSPPSAPKTVLVVDDEDRNRRLLDALLVPEGYEVLTVDSGAAALEVIAKQRIDVVLLDQMMPEMDGLETCRRIRQKLGRLDLPIVFVSALTDRASRVAAKSAGADEFLCKPIDEVELLARLGSLMQIKAYHDLRERQRELLEAELDRRSAQLLRADRLVTLGTLAGAVGHELNNVSSLMITALTFVRERMNEGLPPEPDDVVALQTVYQHLRTHASQLLSFGRPGPDHAELIDLRGVVQGALHVLRTAGRTKGIAVDVESPTHPLFVTVNPIRVEQVLINLVGNAVDALAEVRPGRRSIRVRLWRSNVDRVSCEVVDTGPGIAEDKLKAVFEPYFTTKSPDRGTGLGLAVVRQIVESYGGRVVLRSTVGEGTSFTFDLPATP